MWDSFVHDDVKSVYIASGEGLYGGYKKGSEAETAIATKLAKLKVPFIVLWQGLGTGRGGGGRDKLWLQEGSEAQNIFAA